MLEDERIHPVLLVNERDDREPDREGHGDHEDVRLKAR
jgi:hypothetical protein